MLHQGNAIGLLYVKLIRGAKSIVPPQNLHRSKQRKGILIETVKISIKRY